VTFPKPVLSHGRDRADDGAGISPTDATKAAGHSGGMNRRAAAAELRAPTATAVYVESAPRASRGRLDDRALRFHRQLPGYERSPLIDAPQIAAALGVRRVWIKNESSRFGLPAYKMLGASMAAHMALGDWLGLDRPLEYALGQIGRLARPGAPTLIAPTDGNHGRAVARYAAMVGIRSWILLPAETAQSRVDAINAERGARADVVDHSYLGTVRQAVQIAQSDPTFILVTDFAGEATGPTPAWVIDGYSTIFQELDAQLASASAGRPSLAVAQVGAGALACAVARWCATAPRHHTPLLTVEPDDAACLLTSLAAGQVIELQGPFRSTMAGLNCDAPSALAYEELCGAVTAAVAVQDATTAWAMQALARLGIEAGESGAAGLAGLGVASFDPEQEALRAACGLNAEAEVLLFVTERITDPVSAAAALTRSFDAWPALA